MYYTEGGRAHEADGYFSLHLSFKMRARMKITYAWREGNRHSSEYDTFKLMSRELRTPILWLLTLIYISLVEFML